MLWFCTTNIETQVSFKTCCKSSNTYIYFRVVLISLFEQSFNRDKLVWHDNIFTGPLFDIRNIKVVTVALSVFFEYYTIVKLLFCQQAVLCNNHKLWTCTFHNLYLKTKSKLVIWVGTNVHTWQNYNGLI